MTLPTNPRKDASRPPRASSAPIEQPDNTQLLHLSAETRLRLGKRPTEGGV